MQVGLAFLPGNLIMAVFSLGLSAAGDALRHPRAAGLGLALAALGLALFARAPIDGSFTLDVLPAMVLLGLGAGVAFNPMLLAAMSDVEPSRSGGLGPVNTAFMMGGALGLAALASGRRAQRRTGGGRGRPQAALNGGYQATFLAGALIAGVAALLSAALVRTRNHELARPATRRPCTKARRAWRRRHARPDFAELDGPARMACANLAAPPQPQPPHDLSRKRQPAAPPRRPRSPRHLRRAVLRPVYVFAVTQISHSLLHDLTLMGAARAGLVVRRVAGLAVHLLGHELVRPRRRAHARDAVRRDAGRLVSGAALPGAFGATGLVFAISYVVIQVGRTLFIVLHLGPSHPLSPNFRRMLAGCACRRSCGSPAACRRTTRGWRCGRWRWPANTCRP